MSIDLEILDDNDVISVVNLREAEFESGNTLKIQQLLEEYKEYVKESQQHSRSKICSEGIECEALRRNGNSKGWRKGKIKFVVQFEPDEIDSHADSNSLDDIRDRIQISQ